MADPDVKAVLEAPHIQLIDFSVAVVSPRGQPTNISLRIEAADGPIFVVMSANMAVMLSATIGRCIADTASGVAN